MTAEHPFDMIPGMARTRVRWSRVAVLAVAAAILPIGAHAVAGASGGHRLAAVRTYVVRPGDTLWSIAARLGDPAADLRPVVDRLQAANRGASVLVPGEVLRVP